MCTGGKVTQVMGSGVAICILFSAGMIAVGAAETITIEATEGTQTIITNKRNQSGELQLVGWYKMKDQNPNDEDYHLIIWTDSFDKETYDINPEVGDRIGTKYGELTTLMINNTKLSDAGLYKRAVSVSGDQRTETLFFQLIVTASSKRYPVTDEPPDYVGTTKDNSMNNTGTSVPRGGFPADHTITIGVTVGICIVAIAVVVAVVVYYRRKAKVNKYKPAANTSELKPLQVDASTVVDGPCTSGDERTLQQVVLDTSPINEDVPASPGVSLQHTSLNENDVWPQQWREQEFTKQNWDILNAYVRDFKTPKCVEVLNILVVGLVGHGKSSFVNTCHQAMNIDKEHGLQQEPGRIHRGNAVAGEASVTKCYRSARFPDEEDKVAVFKLYDTMGQGDDGITSKTISIILRGHCKDGYKFANASLEESKHYRAKPTLKDRIHCVAVCVDAVQLMNEDFTPISDSLPELKAIVQDQELKMYVLVTKIDNLCKRTDKNTTYALCSPEVKNVVESLTSSLGIEDSKIYPIRNYVKEAKWDVGIEILALSALKSMLQSANNYVKSCEQDDEE